MPVRVSERDGALHAQLAVRRRRNGRSRTLRRLSDAGRAGRTFDRSAGRRAAGHQSVVRASRPRLAADRLPHRARADARARGRCRAVAAAEVAGPRRRRSGDYRGGDAAPDHAGVRRALRRAAGGPAPRVEQRGRCARRTRRRGGADAARDRQQRTSTMNDRRLAWPLLAPALAVIALISIFPISWTAWESLHRHDLRMPWLGQPYIGLRNYAEVARDGRFWSAMAHTAFFTVASVALELVLGLLFALAMKGAAVRTAILIPWSMPTVVAALLWRFLFNSHAGLWFTSPHLAWIPVILADVWKTTPFVALLLLAGLQAIPRELYEAASVDGATPLGQLLSITLPLLRPAIVVALIFRTLDATRVFDLIYVLTSGGPGTATEPIALYTFNALFQNLRSGYAAALSVIVFAVTFAMALVYVRVLGGKESA